MTFPWYNFTVWRSRQIFTVAAQRPLFIGWRLRFALPQWIEDPQWSHGEQFDCNGQYFKVDANTNSQVGALKWGALGLYRDSPELPGALQSH